MSEHLRIGELAKEAGVNLETIRFYERKGLLPKPPRTQSGYRIFPSEAGRRMRFIKRAQDLGFSLKEIKELLALRVDAGTTCAQVRKRAETKIAGVDDKIRALKSIKRALTRVTSACTGRGPASRCPILDALDSEENPNE